MNNTLGKRIAALRREKGMTQEDLAGFMGVSAQAVSKWENDLTCPDISALPQLAELLGVSVDELLSGKRETGPAVRLAAPEERRDISKMMLRVVVDSKVGDKVRVNLPMALLQAALDMGVEFSQISGKSTLKNIDLAQIMRLVEQGVVGNLVEAESVDGDIVRIFVE